MKLSKRKLKQIIAEELLKEQAAEMRRAAAAEKSPARPSRAGGAEAKAAQQACAHCRIYTNKAKYRKTKCRNYKHCERAAKKLGIERELGSTICSAQEEGTKIGYCMEGGQI